MKTSYLKTIALMAMMLLTSSVYAQTKTMYVPNEWQNRTDTLIYSETDTGNKYTWSKSRSLESDNVIVLWDKGYGSTAPNKLSTTSDYYVDINDLLTKAEAFYKLECSSLGFVDAANSNLAKYKVMILLNHSTEWICYGGGYDYQVPALWISPSTCKPVGSAVAHEVGHSFHYMCYSEASSHGATSGVETGFHSNWSGSNGQAIWETTANWQALQSYPDEFFTESGTCDIFAMSHNYAFSHEWQRYQAYPFLYYLCEKYDDIKTIANVWNQSETTAKDFCQVLMDNKSLSVNEFYKLYYDFASKCVTWDFAALKNNSSLTSSITRYTGNYKYNCIQTADNTYQVAYASCPQSTGFNVVPLQVPASGTAITVDFTALEVGCSLSDGDPKQYMNEATAYASASVTAYNANASNAGKRGFRIGFVALLKDGTRSYSVEDKVYGTASASTASIGYTVPGNVSKLWMVVVPAPTSYIRHSWDETYTNDDQWPYSFKLTGTDIGSAATVTQGSASAVTSKTFAYYVDRYAGLGYTSQTLDITSDISAAVDFLGCSSASDATVYAVKASDNSEVKDAMDTYDGWFDENGDPLLWSSGPSMCTKFYPINEADQLILCTYPDKDTTVGTSFTTTWELAYNGKKVYFAVNTNIVEKPAVPLSDYTVVKTYDFEVSQAPQTDFTTTSVTLPADEIASALGLSAIADAKLYGRTSADGLATIYTANAGYWLDADGFAHAYDGGTFFVEIESDMSALRVGQMPNALSEGSACSTVLYLCNTSTKQLVQLNITLTLPVTAVTIVNVVDTIKKANNGEATISDIEEVANKVLGK